MSHSSVLERDLAVGGMSIYLYVTHYTGINSKLITLGSFGFQRWVPQGPSSSIP